MPPTTVPRAAVRFGFPVLATVLLTTVPAGRLLAAPGQTGHGLGRGNHPGSLESVEQAPYDEAPTAGSPAPSRTQAPASTEPLHVMSTFFVTTTADTGGGSLRAAIVAANSNPGLDQIHFLIVPGGAQTIAPAAPLPEITDPVILDGTTQPGFSGTPIIELTGVSAGPNAIGLVVKGGNSTIRGLVINRWATTGSGGYGIVLDMGSNNVVEGNYIGTDLSGVLPQPNAVNGIAIFGTSTANVIGGLAPQARNVISGNTSSGIQVGTGSAGGNTIRGNYIGLSAFGSSSLPNGGNGVFLNAPGNVIGGTVPGAGNVISGNALPGIFIGLAAAGTVVQGNYIGTDATGMFDIGNLQNGINIDRAPNNIIGDSTGAGRNVISGNQFPAVYVFGAAAIGNQVQGNFLCVDRAGTGALGDGNGIVLDGASGTRVGGTTPAARNVIGGTPNVGIAVINGATGNVIVGNYIGTDSSGVAPLANLKGVVVNNCPGNFIGGHNAGEGNVISGNSQFGVELRNAGATANRVFGNRIGTTASGSINMGNGSHGVVLCLGASMDSVIGNVVAFNHGVGVYDSSGTNNVIRRNAIFENTGRGIDLFPLGLSPNDSLDADAGANELQNYPVLDSASVSNGETRVFGRFNGRPDRTYVLEFFSSDAVDPSHFGEGQTYLDAEVVHTDLAGNAILDVTLPAQSLNKFLTATATDSLSGTTSEFSQGLCLKDTDGDGIWDCWETEGWGIDVNSDGVIDLDLYARGARPGHKDIFVEVDAMIGHVPQDAVLQMVESAFGAVPNSLLQNPDLNPGIALHCRPLDESDVPSQDLPSMWSDFDAVKTARFGTVAERSSPNRYYILKSKRLVYRYGLWGRTFCTGNDTLAGGVAELANGLGGNDFLISLGSRGPCGWRDTADVSLRAGVFMHELGHTLGLGHGGVDDVQFKPNYYSVMNYAWTTPLRKWQAPGSWRLDYSRAGLPALNEAALHEPSGLMVPSGVFPVVTVPYTDAQKVVRQARLEPGAKVDWSGDGTIGTFVAADINLLTYGKVSCGDGAVDSTVSADQVLVGSSDWSRIKYNFRNSPAWQGVLARCGPVPAVALASGSVLEEAPLQEPTRQMLEAMTDLPSPRPQGHFVMDGLLDVPAQLLDSNAGISLYAAYQAGQLYVATGAAPAQDGDVVVFLSDTPGALRSAPLGKAGQAGAWKSFLWNATSDNTTEWADDSGVPYSSVVVDTAAGIAEGVVDVGLLFGSYPEVLYLAVGKYAGTPGGALLAQVPAGNGDANLDGSEYLEFVPTAVSVPPPAIGPRIQLGPIQPNPAVGVVRAALTLREPTDVDVAVQDVSGRRIATIARGTLAAGRHELLWNASAGSGHRPPGVYFLVVRALGQTEASRIILLR
jgi:hypothetical protein